MPISRPWRSAGFALAGALVMAAGVHAQDTPTAPTPPAAPAAAPADDTNKIQVSGFLDLYTEYNFNRPPKTFDDEDTVFSQNTYRNFDFKDNEFALNLAEFTIQKAAAPVGFRVDIGVGKTADAINLAEPSGSDTYKYIQQAYITAPVKFWGKNDTLDIGKFFTSAGEEVVYTKDNFNYTRSLLFALAIPYYHMGLRYTHPINDTSTLGLQLINGWNDVEDNNSAPSYGITYNKTFSKKFSLAENYYGGPELPDNDRDWRHLSDTVLTYTASDTLTLALNGDYGYQKLPSGHATWYGVAGYVRKALTPKTAVSARAEWYDDKDGFTTGFDNQKLYEGTLTYEWKTANSLTTRAEVRYDKSNDDPFLSHGDNTKDNQTTVLLGTVYTFS